MRVAIAFVMISCAGCAAPTPTATPPPSAPVATTASASPTSDAAARADALIADMQKREAEYKKAEAEVAKRPPMPIVNEVTPRSSPSPTLASAPNYDSIPEAPTRALPSVEILSSSYAVTERNDVYWRFSWKMAVRNQERTPIVVRAGLEFKDSRGFILNTDDEMTTIDGATISEFAGFTLVRVEQAQFVTQATAVARKVR